MAPTASAATKEKTVKGEVVFAHGQRPGDPGDCSAIVFVKWADVPGTVSARAIYTFSGSEQSESLLAPFNDTFQFVANYQVPAGYNWIAVVRSWANGPVVNTCEATSEKQKQIVGTEASVDQHPDVAAAQGIQPEGEEVAARQDREGQDEARCGGQAREGRLLTGCRP